jgi:hypothetical protein
MPRAGSFSFTWRAFTSVNVWIGDRPEFSASARGTLSSASEKARNAYCSRDEIWQMWMLQLLFINNDQLWAKNNSVSSKFSYFSRNEKCVSQWKSNVMSSMNGRDFPYSHHQHYRLSEMTVSWCEANSACKYDFVMNLKYDLDLNSDIVAGEYFIPGWGVCWHHMDWIQPDVSGLWVIYSHYLIPCLTTSIHTEVPAIFNFSL